ncbi:MAG: diguanylate cyclase, partial [Magnetococcales bacterium]|nr:diguanylate cyclase [Magnetococcales bacterium]
MTRHPLDPALDFIEGISDDRDAARKAIRDARFKSALETDPDTARINRVLLTALANTFRAGFEASNDQVKIDLTDRLIRHIQRGRAETHLDDILDEMRQLSSWIRESEPMEMTEASAPSMSSPSTTKTLPHPETETVTPLLKAIRTLGEESGWLVQETDTLLSALPSLDHEALTKRLAAFVKLVDSRWPDDAAKRRKEHQAVMSLVTELAAQLHEIHQSTGGLDDQLGNTIKRISDSRRIEDLSALREILLKEAHDLKTHTRSLKEQLATSQGRLEETRARLVEAVTELERTRTESLTDPLTKVANRRALDARMEIETARAIRHKLPLTLILIDLDHFKHVNDTYGHPVGDK